MPSRRRNRLRTRNVIGPRPLPVLKSASSSRAVAGPLPHGGALGWAVSKPRRPEVRAMRIAQVAPLFVRIPPQQYGGTERVVQTYKHTLLLLDHEVQLFAARGKRT